MKHGPTRHRKTATAFTLLEVLLAIGIATGLLVVALHFYLQAAGLRTQLLEESERLATIRQLMDRITADLRTVPGRSPESFAGDSNSMRFVKTGVLSRMAWAAALPGRRPTLETDLKLVNYSVSRALEGTNLVVTGFTRTERVFIEARLSPSATNAANSHTSGDLTNRVVEPLTDAIHFVRFRYWDGSNWVESWAGAALPQGVEVTLGTEPLPEGEHPDDYPYELFRRVVHLPGSARADNFGWVGSPSSVSLATTKNR